MDARRLELVLLQFEEIAAAANPGGQPAPYIIDAYIMGGSEPLSGTLQAPNKQTGLVRMDLWQYGDGTDIGVCVLDCAAITALHMRKPN